MNPQSILAITDLSDNTDAVLSRAALLAAEHGASLKLMYARPVGDLPCPDAVRRLTHHASQLGQRHRISVHASIRTADCFDDVVSAARNVDLVVTGASNASLQSFFFGRLEERLLRVTRRPVLVIRPQAAAAQSAYARFLVAVDFSEASRKLAATAFVLGKSAEVELFHAISTDNDRSVRYAEISEESINAYREEYTRHANDRLFWLTDSSDARRNRVDSAIGYGDPARQVVVQQQHSGSDLVVVGKHPASALSDFVFGSVSQRVLRYAHTDVMVIPHGFEFGTSSVAVRRLSQEQPLARRRIRAGAP